MNTGGHIEDEMSLLNAMTIHLIRQLKALLFIDMVKKIGDSTILFPVQNSKDYV